ncbi:hypothetical protein [Sphingomonas radiodurans]|uniref:hypothetical protein n=1 Tax=Sphingomonas radiodurans TaxID=2890321 RepID=UPI001E322164|nr:hypothetical protein [Sphingomonas radiodurans]WBH17852.1 hypothetical protein LLW23_07065 [Sphingomonas radiodurans]
MPDHAAEAAYCARRIARSTALAIASTDSCARASHHGLAVAYAQRLAALTHPDDAGDPSIAF